jgi:hypothetical protein
MNAMAEVVGYSCAGDSGAGEDQPIATNSSPKLQVVNGAQKRRINRQVARAVAIEMLVGASGQQLDTRLLPVDRVQQRWAVSIGSGLPSDEWDDSRVARPPPLDDETAIIVDQININAPPRQAHLLKCWYKTAMSTSQIADAVGVSRSGLFVEYSAALTYLRNTFLRTGHKTLIDLLMWREG